MAALTAGAPLSALQPSSTRGEEVGSPLPSREGAGAGSLPRRGALAFPALLLGADANAQSQPPLAPPSGSGLHARAASKGLVFGAALHTRHLAEPGFAETFAAECGLVVGEGEQQWHRVERRPGEPDWAAPDSLATFAAGRDMLLRGHSLIWHQALPPWTEALEDGAFAAAFDQRIMQAGTRYADRISSWDVVNEALRPEDGRADGLRDTPLLRRLGPDWVARAFRLARQAMPGAVLVYNDFGTEHAAPDARLKRRAVLRLLEGLRRDGVPVGAFGAQSHLTAGRPFDAAEWRGFLGEVEALGLAILVSELDVNDRALPAAEAPRDAAVAELTRRFLDATLDCRAVRSVITWCLCDRHSWIRTGREPYHRRTDAALPRPLPLDDALRRKPMWSAIATALDAAPPRAPG